MSNPTVTFLGETCSSCFSEVNGQIRIDLFDEVGAPMACATVWVEGLGSGEVAIKDYSENKGILDALLSAKVVEPPHRYVASGFVTLPICRMA